MLDSFYVLDLRLAAARPCDSPRSVLRDAGRSAPDLLRAVGALKHQSETVTPRADTCSTFCMCWICDWLPRGCATAPAASCAMLGEMGPICYEQWARSDIKVRPSYHAQTHARQFVCARFAIGCRVAAHQPPQRPARCWAKWGRICYVQWARSDIKVRPSCHAQTHARQFLCARFAIGCRAAVRQPPQRPARCGAKCARFVTSSGRAQTSK